MRNKKPMKFYGEAEQEGLAGSFKTEHDFFTIQTLLSSLNLKERKSLIQRIKKHNKTFGDYKEE